MERLKLSKTINGLLHCRERNFSCAVCPYQYEQHRRTDECLWARINEMIELSKENIPVQAEWSKNIPYCGECGGILDSTEEVNFCPKCGQAVIW